MYNVLVFLVTILLSYHQHQVQGYVDLGFSDVPVPLVAGQLTTSADLRQMLTLTLTLPYRCVSNYTGPCPDGWTYSTASSGTCTNSATGGPCPLQSQAGVNAWTVGDKKSLEASCQVGWPCQEASQAWVVGLTANYTNTNASCTNTHFYPYSAWSSFLNQASFPLSQTWINDTLANITTVRALASPGGSGGGGLRNDTLTMYGSVDQFVQCGGDDMSHPDTTHWFFSLFVTNVRPDEHGATVNVRGYQYVYNLTIINTLNSWVVSTTLQSQRNVQGAVKNIWLSTIPLSSNQTSLGIRSTVMFTTLLDDSTTFLRLRDYRFFNLDSSDVLNHLYRVNAPYGPFSALLPPPASDYNGGGGGLPMCSDEVVGQCQQTWQVTADFTATAGGGGLLQTAGTHHYVFDVVPLASLSSTLRQETVDIPVNMMIQSDLLIDGVDVPLQIMSIDRVNSMGGDPVNLIDTPNFRLTYNDTISVTTQVWYEWMRPQYQLEVELAIICFDTGDALISGNLTAALANQASCWGSPVQDRAIVWAHDQWIDQWQDHQLALDPADFRLDTSPDHVVRSAWNQTSQSHTLSFVNNFLSGSSSTYQMLIVYGILDATSSTRRRRLLAATSTNNQRELSEVYLVSNGCPANSIWAVDTWTCTCSEWSQLGGSVVCVAQPVPTTTVYPSWVIPITTVASFLIFAVMVYIVFDVTRGAFHAWPFYHRSVGQEWTMIGNWSYKSHAFQHWKRVARPRRIRKIE
eukprot:GILJ01014975.1.p1 GENE.GILJ01014975.1~~GILJ01014975.1.p1  ORF type:complete len:743 (+),score=38.89 GILJ01014975.1:67-2295(+)